MKRLLGSTFLTLILLTGCKPDPRGPVEVIGKTYFNKMGTEFAFTDKENVKVTDIKSGKVSDLKYTLAGEDLTVNFDSTRSLKFRRSGNSYYDSGNRFEISEKTDADSALIAKLQEDGRKEQEQKKRMDPQGAPSAPASYISAESIGDENSDWATWIAMAWNADAQDADTLLGVLPKAWYSNQDSFERQAIKTKELARIEEKLEQVKKVEYLAITSRKKSPIDDFTVFLDSSAGYDFDKKSFKLVGAFCNSNMSYSVRSGATVSFANTNNSPFCYLPVPDQAIAKQLEVMRVNNQQPRFDVTVYSKIAGVDGSNRIMLVPIALDYTISKETYKPVRPEDLLLKTSHWPYK